MVQNTIVSLILPNPGYSVIPTYAELHEKSLKI